MNDLGIMSQSKDKKEDDCQLVYWNLIKSLDRDVHRDYCLLFIREIFQADCCDKFMKDRTTYAKLIGNGPLERVLLYRETEEDRKKCIQAMCCFKSHNLSHLVSALDWNNWLYYYSFYKLSRFILKVNTLN